MRKQDNSTRQLMQNAPRVSAYANAVRATLNDCKKTWELEKQKIEQSSSSQTAASRSRLQRLDNMIKNSTTRNTVASKQMLSIAEAFSNVLHQRNKK